MHRPPAPLTGKAFAVVHLVVLLVFAGLAEQIDVLLVGSAVPQISRPWKCERLEFR